MHHFHLLKTVKVKKETNDSVHIAFEIPADLRHAFTFKQGQYLNVRLMLNGEDLRRSYSIVNAPSEGNTQLEILVKHLPEGKVSTFFNEVLKEGDSVEVQAPMGHFYTHHHPSNEKTYVGLAAGSGISPVLSNLKEALLQEPKSIAYLFFSNKTVHDIIFRKEIDALAEKFAGRLHIIYLLSREKHTDDVLFEGRICADKLHQLLSRYTEIPVQQATYFICGPSEMIKDVSGYFKNTCKVPSLQIMYEYYAAPDDDENAEMSDEFKAIPNIESMVTLIIDDDEYSFHLNSKKKSILDQALHDKLPVPFACKGGVCCTCKAQVMEGEVFMEKNFALTEEEVARGFVLTCQCHPTTNVVMLNYDV
ncbi:phenylacetate-CoA oxygenase [Chryseobacterium sp. 6424]|uniref:FAD-binding oxidoreductase n=1 Tax=Chryseobacterium sp. 6424 TaxID=2039166 RepID=UPI000EFAB66C|nr:FAD-binding oxidoreductase [Chryseobacterium sp. 6424]AYO58516.1 phenylacetate-CoA oxygenase [Chryseobacterium sp. 6424]